jgi:LacI family transcriptional regulator, repressor for deo operon, udp, cdd, tsx, nupC, and nupG
VAVTIKDVAKKAGVAHTTVSRALRGSPLISPATTERVRQIASEMGYQPSAAARSLKTNRSQALGVIVSAIDDPFFSEILQGIDDVAQENGYSLFIAASQRDLQRERLIVRTMREHRVDGVIICSTPFSAEQSKQLRAYEIPIVVINNQSAEDYRYSIYHDDLDGSRQVMRHLIGLGHERIAYLCYGRSGRTNIKRLTGYREEMQAARLTIHDGYEFEVLSSDPEAGQTAAEHFLSLPQLPTAIFCYNDMLAIGLLHGLQEAGLRVPKDCSVAGFDNIALSAFTTPSLTTFDQPKRTIGAQAAQLVLGLLELSEASEPPGPKIQTLKGSLLVRGSTARPAGG